MYFSSCFQNVNIYIYIYMNQTMWCQTQTNSFQVCNSGNQGGVLSLILFAVYVNSMIGRLAQSGVGCHIVGNILVLYFMPMTLHWLRRIGQVYALSSCWWTICTMTSQARRKHFNVGGGGGEIWIIIICTTIKIYRLYISGMKNNLVVVHIDILNYC